MTTHLRDLIFTPATWLGVVMLRFQIGMLEIVGERVEMTAKRGVVTD